MGFQCAEQVLRGAIGQIIDCDVAVVDAEEWPRGGLVGASAVLLLGQGDRLVEQSGLVVLKRRCHSCDPRTSV